MTERAIVPTNVNRFGPENVSTHLDYNSKTHPRQLNPSADAQRVLDGLVNNSGIPGVQERVAYDGGFRVGANKDKHAQRVVDTLSHTSFHYKTLAAQARLAGNGSQANEYSRLADEIGRAEVTYARTTAGYWRGLGQTTPADVVRPNGTGGEALLGENGQPVRRAVGQ